MKIDSIDPWWYAQTDLALAAPVGMTNELLDDQLATGRFYSNVLQAVYGQPWAIRPEMLATICELVRFRADGGLLSTEEIRQRIAATPARSGPVKGGAVAVLPLYGPIFPRANMMQQVSGGTSAEMFGKMFQAAVADPAISAVVLDVDSPGGIAAGIPELWQTIMDARGQKPVVAVANSMAASAAYWVATAADEIVVTPSSEVGSIGVFLAHEDISAAQVKQGVKTTLVSAGKRKVWGNPYEPLSDEARVDLQAKVNAIYETFLSAVAKGRGVRASEVRSGFGEGGMVLAKDAVEAGMADRVGTLAQVLDRLTGVRRGPGGAKAEAEEHDLQRLRRAAMLH